MSNQQRNKRGPLWAPVLPQPNLTDKRLKKLYDSYNYLYFDSKLPTKNIEISWVDMSEYTAIGATTCWDEEGVAPQFSIHIDSNIKEYGTIVKLTLLHEMCHVKLHPYNKHGKRFEEEMIRLALRGAFKGLW